MQKDTQSTTLTLSASTFVEQAKAIPLLTLEEEQDLARRWHEHQDIDAARRLVLSHLRFVVKIARKYSGHGLPFADLVQEGNIGLMKAVKRFDPAVGVRLVTFALHWIKAEIHEYILKNWRIVKVATTKSQRKLFFNLNNFKKSFRSGLTWLSKEEVTHVAQELAVSEKDVREMESRMHAFSDVTFDRPAEDDDQTTILAPSDYLTKPEQDPARLIEDQSGRSNAYDNLTTALTELDERSQDILQSRWLAENKATLHELAERYHVSAERIRQLEKNAMNKLKTLLVN